MPTAEREARHRAAERIMWRLFTAHEFRGDLTSLFNPANFGRQHSDSSELTCAAARGDASQSEALLPRLGADLRNLGRELNWA